MVGLLVCGLVDWLFVAVAMFGWWFYVVIIAVGGLWDGWFSVVYCVWVCGLCCVIVFICAYLLL